MRHLGIELDTVSRYSWLVLYIADAACLYRTGVPVQHVRYYTIFAMAMDPHNGNREPPNYYISRTFLYIGTMLLATS